MPSETRPVTAKDAVLMKATSSDPPQATMYVTWSGVSAPPGGPGHTSTVASSSPFRRSMTLTDPASRLGTKAWDPSHITSAGYGRSPVAWNPRGAPSRVSTVHSRSENSVVIQVSPRTVPGVNSDGPAPTPHTAPVTIRPSSSSRMSVESRNWLTSQPPSTRMRSSGVSPASQRATTADSERSTTAIRPSPLRATQAVSPSGLNRMPCGPAPTSIVAPTRKGPSVSTDPRGDSPQAAASAAATTAPTRAWCERSSCLIFDSLAGPNHGGASSSALGHDATRDRAVRNLPRPGGRTNVMYAWRGPGRRPHATLATMLAVLMTLGCGDATGPEPPAAGEIVFTSIRERFMRIWVANADGTGQRPLTPEGETSLEPSWAPDGSRIVFTSWLDGNPDIFLMDADGSDWRPVTRDTAYDRSGRLSPDGRRVVFVSERTGDPDIWVIDVDGSNPVNLTRSPSSFDVDPGWSPDGARIVFASDRDGNRRFSLWTMRADGTGLTRLPAEGGARSPSWSPDGSRIVFTSYRDIGDAEIYVMRADGSGQTNLSGRAGVDELPRWSPDGEFILFSTKRDGNSEIYAMRADGSGPVNLSRHPRWDAMAAWRP
ncbi:MAG: hypothetical protein F4X22_07275 [Gemmatimonadales bacterium]|nr:hypothetical protein [Candidatus Palauibacter denitrificans]